MSFFTGIGSRFSNSDGSGESTQYKQLVYGSERTRVVVEVFRQGRDLVALVTGGEVHVGATAVCHAGYEGSGAGLATSVIVTPGHKEGPLAEEVAFELASAASCTCVAIVGIHQDNATKQEILDIVSNVQRAVEKMVEYYRY